MPLKYQRFLQVAIPLEKFLEDQPLLDTSQLMQLMWQLNTVGSTNVDIRLGLDDILFR